MIIVKTINYKHLYYDIYGHHFNEKSCLYAIDLMKLKSSNGELIKLTPITIGELMALSTSNNINISKFNPYDCLYLANMCKADFLGSAIPDNVRMLLFIKNTLDDPDGYEGLVFNRWKSDQKGLKIQIDWKSFL